MNPEQPETTAAESSPAEAQDLFTPVADAIRDVPMEEIWRLSAQERVMMRSAGFTVDIFY